VTADEEDLNPVGFNKPPTEHREAVSGPSPFRVPSTGSDGHKLGLIATVLQPG
jgi:hypothetical protein